MCPHVILRRTHCGRASGLSLVINATVDYNHGTLTIGGQNFGSGSDPQQCFHPDSQCGEQSTETVRAKNTVHHSLKHGPKSVVNRVQC
jgi:hypothetical protein